MKKKIITLASCLVMSGILMAGIGAYLKYAVLKPLGIERDESIIAIPFVIMADDMLQYSIISGIDQQMHPTEPPTIPQETDPVVEITTVPATTVPVIETTVPTEPQETIPPTTEPVVTEPIVTEPVYQPVDVSWFDDALFIGESRTTGLRDYARLGNADYFCEISMTVFTVREWACRDDGAEKKTLEEVLNEKTYGKVFIHLGLNECGQNLDIVMEHYEALVDYIREKQPNAVIILQASMSLTRRKAEDPYFAIENVKNLNSRIAALAEQKGCRFSDVNQWVADEEGYMQEHMTADGCHLFAQYYGEWSQWIRDDAARYGIP